MTIIATKITADISGLHRLPSLPHTLTKLLEALQDDRTDIAQLGKLIEMDMAMSAKLIAAANSAVYRRSKQIVSIQEGIMMMGWDMVKTLALNVAMQQMLNSYCGKKTINLNSFWRHSLFAAVLAKQLAQQIDAVSADEAYLAGLLHDIGRLALNTTYAVQYNAMVADTGSELALLAEETRTFGANHAELGAWLIEDWAIKSFLQDAIAFHHHTAEALEHTTKLVRITHLAADMSESYPHLIPSNAESAKKWFGLEFETLDNLLISTETQVQAMATSLGININTDEHDPLQAVQRDTVLPATATSVSQKPGIESTLANSLGKTALLGHLEKVMRQPTDDSGFYATLQQTAWLLCSAKQALLFEVDAQGQRLNGSKLHQEQPWVEEFSFPIGPQIGLIPEALLSRQHTHSFNLDKAEQNPPPENKTSLPEYQLMKLCGAEGLLCLPMLIGEKAIGVMVLAIDSKPAKELLNTLFLPEWLAHLAANYLNEKQQAAIKNSRSQPDNVHDEKKQQMDRFVHETSNPLSTIKNYLEILRIKMSGTNLIDEDLRIVNDEIDRVSLLISQFSTTNDKPNNEPSLVDVNQIIRDVLALHKNTHLTPRNIEARLQLDQASAPVFCISSKLRQVLINLIRNAAEAMHEGGELSLATFTEYVPGETGWLVIRIEDNGPGIPEAIREKLFSAVKTTKDTLHKGIGLSIVAELVAELDGRISCRTSKNVGTSFEIRLPYQ